MTNKEYSDKIFSDDFEITYTDEEIQAALDASSQKQSKPEEVHSPAKSNSSAKPRNTTIPAKNSSHARSNSSSLKRNKQDKKRSNKNLHVSRSTLKTASTVSKKTIKTSGKLLQFTGKASAKLAGICLRYATLIIIAVTATLIGTRFYRGASAFGSIANAVAEENYEMVAYLGIGIVLLLFEAFAFLRSMSRQKIVVDSQKKKQDTGRGLVSFLILFGGSYLANSFWSLIPSVPSAANGAKAGIQLYGSLQGTLFILCTAGVISCICRAICGALTASSSK